MVLDGRIVQITGLESLGIAIDPVLNDERSKEPRIISIEGAPIVVMIVPTNEELAIARQCVALIEDDGNSTL